VAKRIAPATNGVGDAGPEGPSGTDAADARVGGGRPLRSYPNWDPERREFVMHTVRDEGSDYDEVAAPEASSRPAQQPDRAVGAAPRS
jgi:hypothetical protein